MCVFYHSEKPSGGQGESQLGGTPGGRKDLGRFLLEEESINKLKCGDDSLINVN